jgi:sugar porter (SP) family MFS transporter
MAEDNIDFYSSGYWALYFSIFIAFLNSAVNGYDLSLLGGLYIFPSFASDFPALQTTAGDALVFALLQIGSICGCLFVAPVIDNFGRRGGMLVGSLIIVIGAILEVATTNAAIFQVGRFLIGFGVVFVTTAAPTYVLEVSHPVFRGRATGFYNTGWNVGAVPASVLVFAFSYVSGSISWRIPCVIQGVYSIIVFFGCFFMPESPRWLVAKGRTEEAIKFFVKYHANGNPNAEIVSKQMAEIEETLAEEKAQNAGSWMSLIDNKVGRYRIFLVICVAFFSQYAGNWIAGYFQSQVESYFGINDTHQKLLFNVITSVISFIFGLVGASLVDKVGRRTILLYGTLSYVLWYLLIIICLAVYGYDGTNPATGPISAGIAAFVFLQIFAICYSLSWTPLNALYAVEVLSNSTRAKGMAFCQLTINAANVFQSYVLSYGLNTWEYKFFSFFLLFNTLAAVVIYFFFPETKGRTLEELEEIFHAPNVVKASLQPPRGFFEEKKEAEKESA